MVFSKVGIAIRKWEFLRFPNRNGRRMPISDSDPEGGFTQRVHIYSQLDCSIIWRGTVQIDPGNYGPNLITDKAMQYVQGKPKGPGTTVITFDGDIKMLGGEVSICFSGAGPKKRYYTEQFRHVPKIIDGIDMVLNHDFYVSVYADKVPGVLMIRKGKGKEKESKEQKELKEERKRQQEENARRQEAERREKQKAEEASRLAH